MSKSRSKIIALLSQEFNDYLEILLKNGYLVKKSDFNISPLPQEPALYLISSSCSRMEACREFITLVKSVNGNNQIIALVKEEDSHIDFWEDLSEICDDILLLPMGEKEFLSKMEFLTLKKGSFPTFRSEYNAVRKLAHTDELTGIGNRRFIMSVLDREIKRSRRFQHPLSLILFDIDYFKFVNDFFGHQTGDVVLKQISVLIPEVLRDTDYFARYGGDEFIIVLTDTDTEGAWKVAEKIRKKIELHVFGLEVNEISITLSLGVTSLTSDLDGRIFIEQADKALYVAKNFGRNTSVLFDPNQALYPDTSFSLARPGILCIEDNPDIQDMIKLFMKDKNISLFSASDGQSALKLFREKNIDLVLLDIYLPDISGYEICEKLKVDSGHDYIPVIIISALNDEEGIIQGYKVGADDYVSKPLNLNILYEKIKVLLRMKHQFNDKVRYYHFMEKISPRILKSVRQQVLSRAFRKVTHQLNNYLMRIELIKESLRAFHEHLSLSLSESASGILAAKIDQLHVFSSDFKSFTSVLENVAQIRPSFDIERLDIKSIVPGIVHETKKKLQKKYPARDMKVRIESSSSELFVMGNVDVLKTIIESIMENSLQHCEGELVFEVFIQKTERHVKMIMSDNGVGIDSANCNKVFEPFFQEREEKHGLGLGLFFVRILVSALEGTVSLSSEINKGTTLEVNFTDFIREEKATEKVIDEDNPTLKEFNILLIEDESDIALQTKEYLHTLPGVKDVMICDNGYSALKMINEKKDFNVFIVDLSVPGISGWHLLEELKFVNAGGIIIVITGLRFVSEEYLKQTFGAHAVLYKPFSPVEMCEILNNYYGGK